MPEWLYKILGSVSAAITIILSINKLTTTRKQKKDKQNAHIDVSGKKNRGECSIQLMNTGTVGIARNIKLFVDDVQFPECDRCKLSTITEIPDLKPGEFAQIEMAFPYKPKKLLVKWDDPKPREKLLPFEEVVNWY